MLVFKIGKLVFENLVQYNLSTVLLAIMEITPKWKQYPFGFTRLLLHIEVLKNLKRVKASVYFFEDPDRGVDREMCAVCIGWGGANETWDNRNRMKHIH